MGRIPTIAMNMKISGLKLQRTYTRQSNTRDDVKKEQLGKREKRKIAAFDNKVVEERGRNIDITRMQRSYIIA